MIRILVNWVNSLNFIVGYRIYGNQPNVRSRAQSFYHFFYLRQTTRLMPVNDFKIIWMEITGGLAKDEISNLKRRRSVDRTIFISSIANL